MNKDCCNSGKQKPAKKIVVDKFLLAIIGTTILAVGLVIFFGTRMGATESVSADKQVVLSAQQKKYDWGEVDFDGGIVSKSFSIKNKGETTLKLYNVKTSCMCTTAQLKTPEVTSKKYGMHEKTANVFEVKPGETAELLVEFDPAFHGPSGVGAISRTVSMQTNDTNNPELSFFLTANVVKK